MAEANAEGNVGGDVILSLPNGVGIRSWRQSDVASIARHASNKKVWDNLRNRMPQPYKESDAEEWIKHCADPANQVRSGAWTPETGSQGPLISHNYTITVNDEAIGSIGFDFNSPTDVYARCVEIGYWIGEEHWGKGIMSAVVPAFVDWGWKTFDILVRMNAEILERNAWSKRCLEKAGFEVEGWKKWGFLKNGVLENAVIMGMLRPGMQE